MALDARIEARVVEIISHPAWHGSNDTADRFRNMLCQIISGDQPAVRIGPSHPDGLAAHWLVHGLFACAVVSMNDWCIWVEAHGGRELFFAEGSLEIEPAEYLLDQLRAHLRDMGERLKEAG